jgi:hypothetical protein
MEHTHPKSEEKFTERTIKFTINEIITYGAFLITFGASIYTFFNAIPEIKRLGEETNKLNINVAVSQSKIDDLKFELEKLNKKAL